MVAGILLCGQARALGRDAEVARVPEADKDWRMQEFQERLGSVVMGEPGIEAGSAVQLVLEHLPMRRSDAFGCLRHLIEHGFVERRRLGRSHHLFDPDSEELRWWQWVAVLRNEHLHLLVELLAKVGRASQQRIQALAEQQIGWRPSTTRYRLKLLLEANIIKQELPGSRHLIIELRQFGRVFQEGSLT